MYGCRDDVDEPSYDQLLGVPIDFVRVGCGSVRRIKSLVPIGVVPDFVLTTESSEQ